jgi:mannose/fructose-specific phosphotransferase system component IIA
MATAETGDALVGLVIVTHAGCGDCLLAAAAGIIGPVPNSTAVGVMMSESFDDIVRRVSRACDEVDTGAGILILTDVHGSSPFRACLAMVDGTRPVEIVAGVNLPMLVKLATCDRRGQRPVEVAELVKEVGKRSIRLGSELTGKFSIPRQDHDDHH